MDKLKSVLSGEEGRTQDRTILQVNATFSFTELPLTQQT